MRRIKKLIKRLMQKNVLDKKKVKIKKNIKIGIFKIFKSIFLKSLSFSD